jgi:hypothetical protein
MRTTLALLLAFAGCSPVDDAPPATEGERFWPGAPRGDQLVARADGLRLSVDRRPSFRALPYGFELVFNGSANQELDWMFSYVPDDAFGEVRVTGPRRFEVAVQSGSILNTLLAGSPLLVDVDTTTGRPADLTAWMRFGPEVSATSTTADVWVADVRSVAVRNPGDGVRYRIDVRSARPFGVVTGDAGMAVTTISPTAWQIDLRYDGFIAAAAAGGELHLDLDGTEQLTLRTRVALEQLALADGDPYAVWPTCETTVEACVLGTPGYDLGACGTSFTTRRCYEALDCSLQPGAPLTLAPAALDGVDAASTAWNQAAFNGGVWGSVEVPAAFDLPACPAAPITLEGIVAAVTAADQNWAGFDFQWGAVTDRAGAAGLPAFSTSYSPEGPALLATIDRYHAGEAVEIWHGSSELPCPNCHEWLDLYVLWYPAIQRAVVLYGTHGWDS